MGEEIGPVAHPGAKRAHSASGCKVVMKATSCGKWLTQDWFRPIGPMSDSSIQECQWLLNLGSPARRYGSGEFPDQVVDHDGGPAQEVATAADAAPPAD